MALILNIETSTAICSVCLSKDGKLLDYREDRQGTSHAKLLTVFIDQLLKTNQLSPQNLDSIAVSSGPGSYTGLRIGISVAKGLCYALDKPLIAVPTLVALAAGIEQHANDVAAFYMPCIDARRMDVYTALYQRGKEVTPASAVTVTEQLQEAIIKYGNIYIGGNATEKCRRVLTHPLIRYAEGVDCDSRMMIPFAEASYNDNQFEDTAYFEPFYLKEFGQKN